MTHHSHHTDTRMSLYTEVIYAATTCTCTYHLLLLVCKRTHHRICIYFTPSHYIFILLTDTVYLCAYYITVHYSSILQYITFLTITHLAVKVLAYILHCTPKMLLL